MKRRRRRTSSEYYDYDTNELNDKEILRDMGKAKEMYENGEILEAASLLRELAGAIESLDPDRI